jgi:glycosyltransferase involved in cell wall biosynthesis
MSVIAKERLVNTAEDSSTSNWAKVGIVTPRKLHGYGVSVRINREIDTYRKYSVPVTLFSLSENSSYFDYETVCINGIVRRVTEIVGFDRLANSESLVRKILSPSRLKGMAKGFGSKVAEAAEKRKINVYHSDDFVGSLTSLNARDKMTSNPLVVGEFADLIHLDYQERFKLKSSDELVVNLKYMLSEVLDKVDFAFFVSPIDRDIAVKELHVPRSKTEVLYEAADKETPYKFEYPQKPINVGYLGMLARWENPSLFVESYKYAHSEIRNLIYTVIGSGPLFKQMKRIAKRTGGITFHGWQPYAKALKTASGADLGVIPTTKARAMPSKLFVYASLGLPVISMKGMWWSERFVKRYDIGYLASSSPESLGDAIAGALNDPSGLEEKGKRARKLIEKTYNWNLRTKTLLEVYEKLFASKGCE